MNMSSDKRPAGAGGRYNAPYVTRRGAATPAFVRSVVLRPIA